MVLAIEEHDVVIVGGGTSGVVAAIAAARNGAETILIEKDAFLGGMMTAGMVTKWHNPFISKGIPLEIVKRMIKAGGAKPIYDIDATNDETRRDRESKLPYGLQYIMPYDHEILRYILFQMVEEAGVNLLLNTLFSDVVLQGDVLKGVIIENKSGRSIILGKVFVDATGDGDVAVKAGAPYEKGRAEYNGFPQPVNHIFRVGGVDIKRLIEYAKEHPDELSFVANGDTAAFMAKPQFFLRLKREVHGVGSFTTTPRKDEIQINITRVLRIDPTDAKQLSKAEVEGVKQVMVFLDLFKKYIPGFESCYLNGIATRIGVRESRRIIGEYILTEEDVRNGKRFDDTIALAGRAIDDHSPISSATKFEPLKPATAYGIPYRCLIPKKINGLLMAGRCISVSSRALTSLRAQPFCMAIGQAAGTAAAICAKEGIIPRDLDVRKLQKILIEQGVYLGINT